MAKQLNILQHPDGNVKEILTASGETHTSFHEMLLSSDERQGHGCRFPAWMVQRGGAGLVASQFIHLAIIPFEVSLEGFILVNMLKWSGR